MSTTELDIIKALAEEGNMRKASERLHLSQPALSQRLQTIEKEWGMQLFIRSQKGLEPTPAGEHVISYAKESLAKKDETIELIASLEDKVHGTLKIACASIIGQTWLPQVLKDYVALYPDAKISLMTGWSSEISKALYEGEAHIGIVRGQTDWKSNRVYLFRDQLYLVDSEISTIDELKDTNRHFIQYKSDSNYYMEIQRWWHKHFNQDPGRQIVVDQIETCKQLALKGIGYAILPSITLSGDEKVNRIPLLNSEEEFELTRDTWMIGYASTFELKQVRAFVDIVQDYAELLRKSE
ncbi:MULTISPECIES: LysR family transcriptional regulator [Sporosarcina]|uniref:LysR family transcriptional regulator n=1 Tax=Sporosarcina TaxID=1569 RepID=UPI000A17B207|nr:MULTISPECIES: LysR family transcriptional regulator [Sporosarcina]ARK22572.1 LysR family transcriptional regulator [Sporosarcina ureae]PIC75067.1 LysR family transcriptional regulator [Sporosarcina sp. P17b]